jgi:hypothetical protein
VLYFENNKLIGIRSEVTIDQYAIPNDLFEKAKNRFGEDTFIGIRKTRAKHLNMIGKPIFKEARVSMQYS